MDQDKWINVDKRTNNLVIRFNVRGFKKQFFVSTGLIDNPLNRHLVRLKRDAILTDIAFEKFDPSLDSYQFKATKNTPSTSLSSSVSRETDKPKYKYDLKELWQRFTHYKRSLLEETTILVRYKAVERSIFRLPSAKLDDAPKIRDWMLENSSRYMVWDNLIYFSHCCEWAVDSGLIPDNPFERLKIKKPKKRSNEEGDYRAFTLQERDIIIDAFEKHKLHSHYATLIKFLFWTGCRPGEAFALEWGDISEDCCFISISKSRNIGGISKGTKNNKKRIFPSSQGSKLQKMLLEIRPENRSPKDLIFRSKTGKLMTGDILSNAWYQSIAKYNGETRKCPGVVWSLADQRLINKYLPPYSCRHTFATWAVASGNTPDQVAKWIGDEVATILKHYVHPDVVRSVCPDF